jgi:hypothetical protein
VAAASIHQNFDSFKQRILDELKSLPNPISPDDLLQVQGNTMRYRDENKLTSEEVLNLLELVIGLNSCPGAKVKIRSLFGDDFPLISALLALERSREQIGHNIFSFDDCQSLLRNFLRLLEAAKSSCEATKDGLERLQKLNTMPLTEIEISSQEYRLALFCQVNQFVLATEGEAIWDFRNPNIVDARKRIPSLKKLVMDRGGLSPLRNDVLHCFFIDGTKKYEVSDNEQLHLQDVCVNLCLAFKSNNKSPPSFSSEISRLRVNATCFLNPPKSPSEEVNISVRVDVVPPVGYRIRSSEYSATMPVGYEKESKTLSDHLSGLANPKRNFIVQGIPGSGKTFLVSGTIDKFRTRDVRYWWIQGSMYHSDLLRVASDLGFGEKEIPDEDKRLEKMKLFLRDVDYPWIMYFDAVDKVGDLRNIMSKLPLKSKNGWIVMTSLLGIGHLKQDGGKHFEYMELKGFMEADRKEYLKQVLDHTKYKVGNDTIYRWLEKESCLDKLLDAMRMHKSEAEFSLPYWSAVLLGYFRLQIKLEVDKKEPIRSDFVENLLQTIRDNISLAELDEQASFRDLWHNGFPFVINQVLAMFKNKMTTEAEKKIANVIIAMTWGGSDVGWPQFIARWLKPEEDVLNLVDVLIGMGAGIIEEVPRPQHGGNVYVMHQLVRRVIAEQKKVDPDAWKANLIGPIQETATSVILDKLKEYRSARDSSWRRRTD